MQFERFAFRNEENQQKCMEFPFSGNSSRSDRMADQFYFLSCYIFSILGNSFNKYTLSIHCVLGITPGKAQPSPQEAKHYRK